MVTTLSLAIRDAARSDGSGFAQTQDPENEMLITFKTPVHADITMFGDVAKALIRMMGHSGTVPGALLAADVPAALQRLKSAVDSNPDAPLDPERNDRDDEARAQSVSLKHRALPLIELLEAAAREEKNVMWDH
jgi:hypothetical protein